MDYFPSRNARASLKLRHVVIDIGAVLISRVEMVRHASSPIPTTRNEGVYRQDCVEELELVAIQLLSARAKIQAEFHCQRAPDLPASCL